MADEFDKYKRVATPQADEFAQYKRSSDNSGYSMTEDQARTLDESRAVNEAQRQNIMRTSRERAQRGFAPFLSPFGVIGKFLGADPSVGNVEDAAFMGIPRGIAGMAQTGAEMANAPNFRTAALKGGQLAGQTAITAMNALHPVGFGLFGGATQAASDISPTAGKIIGGVMNPAQTITNPQTTLGQEVAKTFDTGLNVAGLGIAPKVGEGVGSLISDMSPEQRAASNYNKFQSGLKDVIPPRTGESHIGEAKYWDDNVRNAAPFIRQVLTETPISKKSGISNYEQAHNIVGDAFDRAYQMTKQPAEQLTQMGVKINVDNVSDAVKNSISSELRQRDPERAAKIEAYANSLGGELTPQQLFERIQKFNAELRPKYYNKSPQAQAATTLDPDIAGANKIASDAMRESLFNKFDEYQIKGVPELRKAVGGLSQVNKLMDIYAEKNRRLDQASAFKGGINSPLRLGVLTGVLSKLFGAGTGATLAAEGAIVSGKAISNMRGKPSAKIGRSFDALSKTNLQTPAPPASLLSPSGVSPDPFAGFRNMFNQARPLERPSGDFAEGDNRSVFPEQGNTVSVVPNPEDWRQPQLPPIGGSSWGRDIPPQTGHPSPFAPDKPGLSPRPPFVPSPTVAGHPQPFVMPDNLRMMPPSSVPLNGLTPEQAGVPSSETIYHQTSFSEDLANAKAVPQMFQQLYESKFGKDEVPLTIEQQVQRYRDAGNAYLEEMPNEMIDKLLSEGKITSRAAQWAKAQKTGRANRQLINQLTK